MINFFTCYRNGRIQTVLGTSESFWEEKSAFVQTSLVQELWKTVLELETCLLWRGLVIMVKTVIYILFIFIHPYSLSCKLIEKKSCLKYGCQVPRTINILVLNCHNSDGHWSQGLVIMNMNLERSIERINLHNDMHLTFNPGLMSLSHAGTNEYTYEDIENRWPPQLGKQIFKRHQESQLYYLPGWHKCFNINTFM